MTDTDAGASSMVSTSRDAALTSCRVRMRRLVSSTWRSRVTSTSPVRQK